MTELKIRAHICWVGLKENTEQCRLLQKSYPQADYQGDYNGFRKWLLNLHSPELLYELNTAIIVDKVYYSPRLQGPINFIDMNFNRETLTATPKIFTYPRAEEKRNFISLPLNDQKDYYKEVLTTYNRVTFFDQFNSFKYILNKDLRKELEDCVYRFFIGLDEVETFREAFRKVETQLKPSQLEKYQNVKDFVFSARTEVLKSLVGESSQETVKLFLDKYSLDYFDVNYLKAYLRDYGKTKEEKGKKKVRVHELKFEPSEELINN